MKKIILLIFISIISNNLSNAQEFELQDIYNKELMVFGIPVNKINNKRSRSIVFFDSAFIKILLIQATIPRGYIKLKGKYIVNNNKILLFKKDRKYKILKIKSNFLYNNILFGIIREEYHPQEE